MKEFEFAKGLLIDLDGVIYDDSKLIPGAAETIALLQKRRIPFRFITNTTMKSRETLRKKLQAFGIQVQTKQIFSAVYAAKVYLKRIQITKCHVMLLPDAQTEFEGFDLASNSPDFVIMGDLGDSLNFEQLNQAFQHVFNGASLMALQKNRFWLSDRGYTLDAGAFVAAIEYAADTRAILAGKPALNFFEMALFDLGLQADQVVMIGDDLESDIIGAQNAGIKAVLMRTGKFRQQDLDNSQVKPWKVLNSIAELCQFLQ